MSHVLAAATALPSALSALPTAAAVGVLCAAVIAAVLAGDQLAYFSGAAVTGWWRRRRPGRAQRQPARRGRAAAWFTAAMPSLAGAAGLGYRPFAARVLVMRAPWLAAALVAGTLAARSLTGIGHAAGIAGLIASAVVVAALLAAHRRPGLLRALSRRGARIEEELSSTIA